MRETKTEWVWKIIEEMSNRYPDAEVLVKDVVKVGGRKKGIIIREKGSNISPQIYLDELEELDVEKACDVIQELHEKNKLTEDFDIQWFTDFEKAKSKLRMKMLHTEDNAEYLTDKVVVPFMDLSIVFCIDLSVQGMSGTITVTKAHTKAWGVNVDDLLDNAKKNTKYTFTDMADVFVEGIPRGTSFILSNEENFNGAGVLPAAEQTLIDEFKKFYLVPSSIDEWIVCPENECFDKETVDNMVNMVHQVNLELKPEKRLSNHAYYFNGEEWEA